MESKIDLNDVVKTYIAIRTQRETLANEYEAKDHALLQDMKVLEQQLLDQCNQIDASSIRTDSGTIIRSIRDTFSCMDWDNFNAFIVENSVPQLLQRRIHQSNFKDYMEQNSGDGLPPGINVMREYSIVVRKPKL